MKISIIALWIVLSATAFFQGQRVEGTVRHCIYSLYGQTYVHTIPAHNICPVTIEVKQ